MKIWTPILILLLTTYCSTYKESTVDRIIDSDKFQIQMHNQGCFGDSDMTFKIFKDGENKVFEFPISLADPNKVKTTILTKEKEIVLREFITEGMKENKGLLCTGLSTYKVGTFWTNISFEDGSCKMYDYLERLMK